MKIAVVGGIGSGKSEVMRAVRDMGIATLSADEINSELLATPSYIATIKNLFPTAVKDGEINRKELARIVFSDKTAREALNEVAHPLILQKIKDDKRSPLVVEVPLIFESGAKDLFDVIVAIDTPLDKRIERLESGRNMTRDEVLARIDSQVDEDEYLQIADHVIQNDGTLGDLKKCAKVLFLALCR